MLYRVLISENLNKYNWITYINDSILLPIHGINNMKNTINKYRLNNDIWGLYLSNEYEIHICSCHLEFNKKCLPILIHFFNEKMNIKFKNTNDFIQKIEIQIIKYLYNFNIKYDGVVKYNQLSECNSIMFNPNNIYKYLSRTDVFGIKWKYLGNYMDLDKLNNPNLNYLMRYLKLGGGIIPDIPNYFK